MNYNNLLMSLLKSLVSQEPVKHLNSKLSNNLLSWVNKQYKLRLVHLNILEDMFANYSWFFNEENLDLYHINIKLDDINLNGNKSHNKLLDFLKYDEYFKIDMNVSEIKRSEISKNNIISHMSFDNIRMHYRVNEYNISKIKEKKAKRKRSISFDFSKKPKKQKKLEKWVSASKVRNYLLNDPLLDWLKEYNVNDIYDIPLGNNPCLKNNGKESTDEFTKYIMEQGQKFENDLYLHKLKPKFRRDIVKVAESLFHITDKKKFQQTVNYMKNGKPIIYQGVLHDKDEKLYGSPDLIIRSDYLKTVFPENSLLYTPFEEKIGSKFNDNFHYVIVDIKHSTLNFNVDNKTLRNTGSIPAYKGQLRIYNKILGNIQNYLPDYSFIFGKRRVLKSKKQSIEINDPFQSVGVIDYKGRDKIYIDLVDEAINWIRTMRDEGKKWALMPKPSVPQLYPNMKNDKDGGFSGIKYQLAQSIDEITQIYYCGVEKRSKAHQKGVYSFKDRKCNSKLLGFKENSKTGKIVDKILEINKQSHYLIKPNKIKSNIIPWRKPLDNQMEFYIDFETMNSNIEEVHNQLIFMVGIGYIENNIWKEETFVSNSTNKLDEINMFQQFYNSIENIKSRNNKTDSIFYHWHDAEPIFYKKFNCYGLYPKLNFIDIKRLFMDEPIVIKGCYNFKLKNVAKSMQKHGMIATSWDSDNICANGKCAMILASKLYKNYSNLDLDIKEEPIMKDIIKYNKVDVKVLYEILDYMRENMQ